MLQIICGYISRKAPRGQAAKAQSEKRTTIVSETDHEFSS